MSLTDIVDGAFSSTTRNRGHAYFQSGQVRIRQSSDQYVTAAVSGSRRTPYAVEIDLCGAEDGQVVATCTCPHYEDGYLCKHIWATLLEMDNQHQPNQMQIQGASILHEYDEDLEEDDDDWDDDHFDEIGLDTFDPYQDRLPWGAPPAGRTPRRSSEST